MQIGIVLLALIVAFGLFFIAALALDLPIFRGATPRSNVRTNMRNLVAAQRSAVDRTTGKPRKASVLDTAKDSTVKKTTDSRLTLKKRLKFAQWNIPPAMFRVAEICVSFMAFAIASIKLNFVMQLMALLVGPLFVRWLLNLHVEKRFKAFDADYPQFLLSLVGLLKTGMNPMQALEAASQGLEEGSLVKSEVELMMERLRFGVSEDKSIGSFGEDVFHPEIELFVQALLLSRRVGGTLSDTLDRLARQVRRRQYFRKSASAAIGMQRGSIWFIIGILAAMEVYLSIVYPEAVFGAWKDETGWQVWQFGIGVILLGIYWVRQVTKIRV